MPGMYLRECLIENVGPITSFDASLSLNAAGQPKPVILVGKNGTGKTILLAYILDALAELAKHQFRDIVIGQQIGHQPFVKVTSSMDVRSLARSSLSLLEFSDADQRFWYVEKVGKIDPEDYTTKRRGRFEGVQSWPKDEPFHKQATGDGKQIEAFFLRGSVCFFPSSRHERPHWLNVEALEDQPLFGEARRMAGLLAKPLVVERAAETNRQWLMDVLLDSLVDGELVPDGIVAIGHSPPWQWRPRWNAQEKLLLQVARRNVEQLLREVLEDHRPEIVLNHRNAANSRLGIRLGDGVIVPSLAHLSAGQALLFNLFATIIRYADMTDLNKSIRLNEIEGIVLIDEVDAHLHTDLQHDVLPRLIKLFPKVQFIVTSHAPLFLLGMEREFGTAGIQILEMPTGRQIGTERFEEFQRSFEHYRQTQAFEDEVTQQVLGASKPLVLTEGETDADYIRTALELLGHTELLEQLAVEPVGKPGEEGAKGGGHTHLDAARKFLENKQREFPRRVLFLFDCDKKKEAENIGQLAVRTVPENPQNTKVTKGIENLLPADLFGERFYKKRTATTAYGEEKIIGEFDKTRFCRWVCQERRCREDFLQLDSLLVPLLREFLAIPDKGQGE